MAADRTGFLQISPAAYKKWGREEIRLHPGGTGPFKLGRWEQNQIIVLEKTPHYCKPGLPSLDRVELRIMKDGLTPVTALRAAFLSGWREKKLKGLILTASGALGNAATRLETYVLSTAIYAYGGHADIDDLFRQQAVERDRTKRETLLLQLQRRMHERVMHAPIFEPVVLHGVGPRVEEPGAGLIPLFAYFGPYEEMRLRKP